MEASIINNRPTTSKGLWVLLLLSLCGNVWLARAMFRHLQDTPPKEAPVLRGVANIVAEPFALTPDWDTNRFHWSMVRSADYRLYLENLRLIGCPAETATNFIARTLIDEFLEKQWELCRPARQDFWDLARRGPEQIEQSFKEPAEKMNRELEALFHQLFPQRNASELLGWTDYGLNYEDNMKLVNLDQGTTFDFLPAKRQEFVRNGLEVPNDGSTENNTFEKALSKERAYHRRLYEILTPQEAEEYDLRASSAANVIRLSLYYFNASPGELRAIAYVIWQAKKEADHILAGARSPTFDAMAFEDERLKSYLGAARFAEFKRAIDPGFRNLALLADYYAASTESAAIAYDMEKEMIPTARELLADPKVSTREKQSGLQDMMETVRQKIRGLFGERALETYDLNGGFALKELAATNSVAQGGVR